VASLVYVHGAGDQPKAADLKQALDETVFGASTSKTRLGYYADKRWKKPGPGQGAAAGSPGRARRRRAVTRATAAPSPEAAAEEIVRATLARPGGTHRVGAAPAGRIKAADRRAAEALAEQMFRNADRIARRSSGGRLGIGLPEPLFRMVVGFFASDVIDYLYAGHAEAMRAPVRTALLADPAPDVIVAHSLGTIITYDVLSEPAFASRKKALLVTLGSPLGIDNVQDRLRDRAGRPNPVPGCLREWANFADRFDPVALDATLRDAFRPPRDFAVDEAVDNRRSVNHDLIGYLEIGVIGSLIREAMAAA
jgi:hypothetical protein